MKPSPTKQRSDGTPPSCTRAAAPHFASVFASFLDTFPGYFERPPTAATLITTAARLLLEPRQHGPRFCRAVMWCCAMLCGRGSGVSWMGGRATDTFRVACLVSPDKRQDQTQLPADAHTQTRPAAENITWRRVHGGRGEGDGRPTAGGEWWRGPQSIPSATAYSGQQRR